MLIRFFTTVNRFPKTILLIILALSAFFFYQAKEGLFDPLTGKIRINSTVEPFIERDSGAYQQFLEAREAFGSAEVVVVALHNRERKPVDLKLLLTLSKLQKDVENSVPGISTVMSMLDIPQSSGTCPGKSYFHQMDYGSVCQSILEKYQHDLACFSSKAVIIDSYKGADESLEAFIESSLEAGPEESLEENLIESPISEEQAQDGRDSYTEPSLDCLLSSNKLSLEKLYETTDSKIRTIVRRLKKHPLFEGDLLSKDLSTSALILTFKPGSNPESDRTQNILKELLTKHQQKSQISDKLRIAYAGQPRQINKAGVLINEDMEKIFPLSILLIVVILLFSFRSLLTVLVPLAVVLSGIIWTAGIVGLIGGELNLVTMVCAPIILCVGSAYVIKFLNQYQIESIQLREAKKPEEPEASIPEIINATIFSVTVPVTVTAITTVAGFIALVVSPIPAVQELGLYSSIGIVTINLFTLTLAPALLHFIHLPELPVTQNQSGLLNAFFSKIVEWLRLHSKRLIIIWLIVAATAVLGMFGLSINSSTKTFPENSPIVKDLHFIENELAGTDSLRLLFKAKTEVMNQQDTKLNPLKTAKTIYGLKNLQDWLFQVNGATEIGSIEGLKIDKIHSPVDVVDHYRMGLDKLTDDEVVKFYAKTSENGPKFLSDSEKILQVTVRMSSSGSTSFLALRDLLVEKAPMFLPDLQFSYTGGGVLASESANNIAQGQINSVILALALVFVMLSMLFLSWKMGVIALFPNVITILVFFGSLGWLDIPIGVTISVIAAIALGIGVDDTIHFLSHYNEYANKLRNKRKASMKTVPVVGRAMLFSTMALAAGFILFSQSEMESVILFGTFTAFTLLACLAIDMTFLPSVVMETGLITVWDYVGLKFDDEFVKDIDMFENMSVREAKMASLMAYTVDMEPGKQLFSQGEIGEEMYVVLNGSISIFLENDESRTDLVRLEKGNTFGEMGLFRNAERSASAEAYEKTRLLVINRDCLEPLKKRHPKIASKLFLNLANNLQSSLKETNERLLAQKDFNLSSLEAKLLEDDKLEQKEMSIDPKSEWEKLGEKWHNKLETFTTQYSVSKGKKLRKINPSKGNFVFIQSGEVAVESRVSPGSNEFSVGYCWTRKDFDLVGEFVLCEGKEDSSARATARKDSVFMHFTNESLLSLTQKESRVAAQFLENLVCMLSDQLAIADKRLQNS